MSEAKQAVEGERNSYLPSLWAEIAHLKAEHNDLLQLLANVQHEAKGVRMELSMFCESSDEVIARVKAMTAEHYALRCDIANLVKALAFYANKENWVVRVADPDGPRTLMTTCDVAEDGGDQAREVLGMSDA